MRQQGEGDPMMRYYDDDDDDSHHHEQQAAVQKLQSQQNSNNSNSKEDFQLSLPQQKDASSKRQREDHHLIDPSSQSTCLKRSIQSFGKPYADTFQSCHNATFDDELGVTPTPTLLHRYRHGDVDCVCDGVSGGNNNSRSSSSSRDDNGDDGICCASVIVDWSVSGGDSGEGYTGSTCSMMVDDPSRGVMNNIGQSRNQSVLLSSSSSWSKSTFPISTHMLSRNKMSRVTGEPQSTDTTATATATATMNSTTITKNNDNNNGLKTAITTTTLKTTRINTMEQNAAASEQCLENKRRMSLQQIYKTAVYSVTPPRASTSLLSMQRLSSLCDNNDDDCHGHGSSHENDDHHGGSGGGVSRKSLWERTLFQGPTSSSSSLSSSLAYPSHTSARNKIGGGGDSSSEK